MRSTLLLLASASLLPAQRLATGPDDRVVQLFDLRKLRSAPPADAPELVSPGEEPALSDAGPLAIAALLGSFVEPPLGKGDSLQPLGEHFVVLLGSAAQVASIERVFTATGSRRDHLVDVEIRFVKLPPARFDEIAKPHLERVGPKDGNRYQKILRKAEADAVIAAVSAADVEYIEAPRLLVAPLQRASLAFKTQTSFIKDFRLTQQQGGIVADPVIETVWDGNETIVSAVFLPDGMIGLSCDATIQEVERPIAEYETKVPGAAAPLKIQLPATRTVRLRQTCVLGNGDAVMLAAAKSDGTFLVALVMATEKKP